MKQTPLETESEIKQSLLGLLARRDYSRKELETKLTGRCDMAMLTTVLDAFAESGYQSDERFAGMLVRNRSGQGYGRMRILQDARKKGLPESIIEEALDAEALDWFELAREAYNKKFKQPLDKQDRKSFEKRMRFLVQRGFSFEQARFALFETEE